MAQSPVYTIAKKMPEFPGGTNELAKYLQDNTQYPAEAREAGATGKAFVNFIVDTNGKVISPKIIKSSGNKALNDEALRVVASMPKWISGADSLGKVNVSINLPISFGIGRTGADSRPTGLSMGKTEELEDAKPMTKEEKAAFESHKKAMTYYDMGIKQAQQERWEFALAKFDQCLAIEPDNRVALSDKANMHIKLMQKKQACETWSKYKSFGYQSDRVEAYIKQYCN